MSGEDIKVKLEHKVASGGSVGRAKLGYVNVRKDFDGRLVNTIDVDLIYLSTAIARNKKIPGNAEDLNAGKESLHSQVIGTGYLLR